ncbi:unnamed protein product [Rhizoctonia solani]|uniref:Myb-like domain-containing protein n=1 Tax=Rhizoctonia solani TaxID=456999 RepID=A0A8H3A7H2_9AGAM|nr:unnamed protein product [Rhizoctonia solani]
MAHRRSTSDSTAPVFVAHSLQFAGQGNEEDKYNAAQRYDWDDVPPKLMEPTIPYEVTQPFDYVVPKKIKVLGNSENLVVGARRSTRTRKDENTPVVSESEIARQLSKKRGRPRRSEASRKTDDGDNTEDESYIEPTSGPKKRSQHQPAKRPRVSRNEEPTRREETDEEQDRDTAPLRSGGARSRVTPIKPQQANRWSNTEDRQLIDSLFEVIGSIPWRRVTAYMAEKGYSCADRGEGAIRGRWKVLRPRLYIVPPPVVRGAAAKSQLKAKEKETTEAEIEAEHEDKDGEGEHEEHEEAEEEREDKARTESEAERAGREAAEQAARDIEDELDAVEAEGDTTVEEDGPPAPRRARRPQGTGPPKRQREPRPERQREGKREREQERRIEMDQGPPTPPRIPTSSALRPPTKAPNPNPSSSARSPVPVSPNPNRRTLPSLQSPERSSERSLPLPVPAVNQRSPRLADTHSPRLPRAPTPPQTGTLLAPMLNPTTMPGWDREREREAWLDAGGGHGNVPSQVPHTSPGRAQHVLPEHHQREYPPHPPSVSHPHPSDPHPQRKSRKPEMLPFRTSGPGHWNQNQTQGGPGEYQGAPGQSGYQGQGQGGYQPPTTGQGGYQAPPPPAGQGSFQTLTGAYQPQGYSSSPGQTYQSPPQTFQPAISPGRVYQTSPRPSYAQASPNQVYHSPSRVYQSPPAQPYHSPPSQTYHAHSPPRQPYHPSPYQGPASQVFPPPPLYVPPPTTFPIENQSPSRGAFQDGPTFPGGSPSRLPMLGERGGIGEGGREWDRIE